MRAANWDHESFPKLAFVSFAVTSSFCLFSQGEAGATDWHLVAAAVTDAPLDIAARLTPTLSFSVGYDFGPVF